MNRIGHSGEALSPPTLPVVASILVVSFMLISGIGYGYQTANYGGDSAQTLTLVVTSMTKTSGPSYVVFTLLTPLPSSSATANAGPFAPGDSIVVSYTVKNIGNIPASLSTLGVSVTPSGNGFTASNGPIPSSLNPGASFSSTITITFMSGLDNTYEGRTATITLKITGTSSTTTSCSTSVTHTATKTVTTSKTTTKTMTITKTTTKGEVENALGSSALWVTTSSCTTVTFTTTITTTSTSYKTTTKTITTTISTSSTTCRFYDDRCR